MLLSIIVPVFNVEKYLNRALDSILDAELQNCEVIVVNDGSTDLSSEILKEYSKAGQIIVIQQENKGLSAARNTGIKYARGKFITFLDSDDYYESAALRDLIEEIHNTDFDLYVFGRINDYKKHKVFPYQLEREDYYEPITYLYQHLKRGHFRTNVWDKIYKLDIINLYDIRFKEGMLYEDADFLLRYLLVIKKIFVSNRFIYHYNLENQNSITKSINLKDLDALKYLPKLILDIEKTSYKSYFFCVLQRWIISSLINKYGFLQEKTAKKVINITLTDQNFIHLLKYNVKQKIFKRDAFIAFLLLHHPKIYFITFSFYLYCKNISKKEPKMENSC